MDKNAIKKYAVWARTELITRVSQRAEKYDITAEADASASSVNGVLLSDAEIKQRKALIEQVKRKGFDQVMEEVAYTWFNRFIALRFMEVNGYLPSHIRVFTDDNNNFKPQILAEAIHLELDGLDMEKVYELKNNNQNDELYKYLIMTQCYNLGEPLPRMFPKKSPNDTDYSLMLFPDNILREGSVIEQMITLIPEEDWKNQVQIVGWLYQYYNSEPKDKVFADLKKRNKITKEKIPAATQLFTPDWIVRYLVENSLGRLWCESRDNTDIKANWKYYIEEVNQEDKLKDLLCTLRKKNAAMRPDEIKCIDPCTGSGHILAYLFDVLVQIYADYGVSTREAVRSIVEKNVFGLDIDNRAVQLAYFSLMMKAVQYDRRFLSRHNENGELDVPQPHILGFIDSNDIDTNTLEYFINDDERIKDIIDVLINALKDSKEYGSIIDIESLDYEPLFERLREVEQDISIYRETINREIKPFIELAYNLSQKYDVVITNPPYLPIGNTTKKLYDYVVEKYPNAKLDLFACFIERNRAFAKKEGYIAMITMHSWMFLSSYEKLRKELIDSATVINMAHLGARAFDEIGGEVVQTTAFVFRNSKVANYVGSYKRLVNGDSEDAKERLFFNSNNYNISSESFGIVPASPFVYWISDGIAKVFNESKFISDVADPRQGLATADNDKFIRYWWEVDINSIGFGYPSRELAAETEYKYFPYNKGGELRRWYGSNYFVVDWYKDGQNIKADKLYKLSIGKCLESNSKPKNMQYYFRKGITWSLISTSKFGVRCFPEGMIFDVGSHCVFCQDKLYSYIAAYLNSDLAEMLLNMLNPTMNFSSGVIGKLPITINYDYCDEIDEKVNECVRIAKEDWDEAEISWDFKSPGLASSNQELIENQNLIYQEHCSKNEKTIESLEIDLNELINSSFGVSSDEIVEYNEKKSIIHQRTERDDVIHYISYAVGCMFGRYSLDEPGLVYAGGEWKPDRYFKYKVDKDNIIPICDDEYFEDDIVVKFIDFVKTMYGEKTLESNLTYIANQIGGNGSSREIIRNYFLNDFYSDHCRIYQKRPIYWLFDSGKKNGFKCLIYIHRYQPDTIARIRTDYVHEQQARYRIAIEETASRIESASGSNKVKLTKKLNTLKAKNDEIHAYEEKIHHLADQMISIDLDDGVKKNYAIFKDVLAKIK